MPSFFNLKIPLPFLQFPLRFPQGDRIWNAVYYSEVECRSFFISREPHSPPPSKMIHRPLNLLILKSPLFFFFSFKTRVSLNAGLICFPTIMVHPLFLLYTGSLWTPYLHSSYWSYFDLSLTCPSFALPGPPLCMCSFALVPNPSCDSRVHADPPYAMRYYFPPPLGIFPSSQVRLYKPVVSPFYLGRAGYLGHPNTDQ